MMRMLDLDYLIEFDAEQVEGGLNLKSSVLHTVVLFLYALRVCNQFIVHLDCQKFYRELVRSNKQ